MVSDILVLIMLTIGSLFILVAAVGVLRMPDFYLRLTVTVKAATFGMGFILCAAAIHFNDFAITTKMFAIIFFLILTAPVGGHIIAKTAYKTGVRLWEGSVSDDLGKDKDAMKKRKTKVVESPESLIPKELENPSDSNKENPA